MALASLIVAIATGLVNLSAAIFVGFQVRLAALQHRNSSDLQQRQWDMERKRATIDFILSTIELRKKLKAALPDFDRSPGTAARVIEQAESDSEAAMAIGSYLDYLENFATGVNLGVLDIEVADRNGGGRIMAMADNFKPFIEKHRKGMNAPGLYGELEMLAANIRQRRSQAKVGGTH